MCPFTANYSVVVLAETLSIFCVVVALVALERWVAMGRAWGWVVVLGCALSGAVLLRPDQGILVAAVLGVMVWVGVRRRVGRGGGGGGVRLMVVLPLSVWAVRNWRVFHVVQPLAPRYANDPGEEVPYGFQRWFRTWAVDYKASADIYWNYDDTRMRLEDLPARAFDTEAQREQTRELFERYNKVVSATPEFDAAFARIAAERVADASAAVLRGAAGGAGGGYVAAAAAGVDDDAGGLVGGAGASVGVCGGDCVCAVECGVSCAGGGGAGDLAAARGGMGVRRWRTRWWDLWRCDAVLLLTLDNSEPRYTLECFPVVIVLASFAVAKVRARA